MKIANKVLLISAIVMVFVKQRVIGQSTDSISVQTTDIFEFIGQKILKKEPKTDSTKTFSSKPILSVFPGVGYSQLKGLSFFFDANISYYSHPKTNLSVIDFSPEYALKNLFTPTLFATIWTKENQWNFVIDWRYFNYFIKDYGLGDDSKGDVFTNYSYNYLRLHQVASKQIKIDFYLGLGYNFDRHYDIQNLDFTNSTNANEYGIGKNSTSSGPVFNILYDTRRNENTPVAGGWYANLAFTQNLKIFRSDENYQTIYTDFRHYIALGRNPYNLLTFRNINWLITNGRAPYLDLPSTQWDVYNNTGRPYIQGRYRGQKMIYLESEYRFNLLKNQMLGGAFFANLQAYNDFDSRHISRPIPGYGASLRILVNKASRVYFNISYGFGINGAKGFLFKLGEFY